MTKPDFSGREQELGTFFLGIAYIMVGEVVVAATRQGATATTLKGL